MEIIERSVIPKAGDLDQCEDGIAVCAHFAAVLDGATDKTGERYEGRTGGRHVMLALSDAVPRLDPGADAYEAVRFLTAAVADALPDDLSPEERPNASATVYSAARREVWQVGDVGYWYEGLDPKPKRKRVDRINAALRAAILKAELLRGASAEDLAADDPGREAIMPLLTRQALFANNLRAGELAHGVLDGQPVPDELVAVTPVPVGITELVLASDGYPYLLPTLVDTESRLKTLLAEDPLCMDGLAGTKAYRPGQESFDDRAYLRLGIA
ncbi:hypothetical protein ABZY36_04445 [Streptomyces sp. NPDC006627]|uniref:hypothetical protein n=1 Tax=Streptomyces sp. NPDC006627 TaxID=3154679 RepID=UPI0033B619D7